MIDSYLERITISRNTEYPLEKSLATRDDDVISQWMIYLLKCPLVREDMKDDIKNWLKSKEWYLDK